jgi:TPR repeat protein
MGIQEYRVALADLAPEDRPEVEQYLREQLLFVDDDWLATVDNIAAEPPFDAEALDLLTDGALAGSADAAFALARCHFIGMDSVPNPDAGLAWMRVAAERGHHHNPRRPRPMLTRPKPLPT